MVLGTLMVGCGNRNGGVPETFTQYNGEDFVTEVEAERIAEQFLGRLRSGVNKVELAATDLQLSKRTGEYPTFYIFNVEPKGFVIVSASELGHSILGYSTESDFGVGEDIPSHITGFLSGYTREIEAMRASLPENWERKSLRLGYTPAGNVIVKPLLEEILWDQDAPYNMLVPERCPIGCVATATAQIMCYWKYPNMGYGSYSYQHKSYGRLGVSYQHPINWRKIDGLVDRTQPNRYPEISRLCYDVAVGLDMDFYNAYSGAHLRAVPRLLSQHYNYSSTIQLIHKKNYHTEEEWKKIIRAELEAKRPVIYAGSANAASAGHAFVCDGYSDADEYHMNWGWSGRGNGWFKLSALTLGGEDYTYDQDAIIGIQPPAFSAKPQVNVAEIPTSSEVRAYKVGYIYIKGTSFNKIATASGASGYTSYADRPLALPVGVSFPYEVEVGRAYGNAEGHLHLYVDSNQDGTFSSDEEVAKGKSVNGKLSGMITLSAPKEDRYYRMRVILSMDEVTDANKDINYGEVEDYIIEAKK